MLSYIKSVNGCDYIFVNWFFIKNMI
jgi:hypothetical protein